MNRRACATCTKADTCDLGCTGYTEDEETAAARTEYQENCADIEREENEGPNHD